MASNILSLAALLFPDGKAFSRGAGKAEVTQLVANATPENCQVLSSGKSRFSPDVRNTLYLVEVAAELVFVRRGAAQPEAGYAEFAQLEIASKEEGRAAFDARIRERINALSLDASES
jgi:hypothetical protein